MDLASTDRAVRDLAALSTAVTAAEHRLEAQRRMLHRCAATPHVQPLKTASGGFLAVLVLATVALVLV